MKKVVVVGAGFSGLVAAWRLQKDGHSVVVVEKANRTGGLIASVEHPLGIVETAANGLLASSLVEELFQDCGLEVQVPKKTAERRYLAVGGRVSRWPLTFVETMQSLFKVMSARKRPPQSGESLDSWARRALGDAAAQKLVAPAMLGIYAASSATLSATMIVGKYFDRSRRSRRGRYKGTVSAVGGLETLLKSLRGKLEERGVVFREHVDPEIADVTVLAVSAWDAAKLLKAIAPSDPRIKPLARVRPIPLISVTLFFKKRPPKLGFGTLFDQSAIDQSSSNDGILGCLQNSEIFEGRAKAGVHSETWILGGADKGDELIALNNDQVLERIYEKRDRLIDPHSRENSLAHVVTRWPQAIPHYDVSLESDLPILREREGRVLLFGNYLGNLGLASILEDTQRLSSEIGRSS